MNIFTRKTKTTKKDSLREIKKKKQIKNFKKII